MNRHTINSRLALSLSTLTLTLLTACGGGGDATPVASTPDVPVQPAATATVCGVVATPVAVGASDQRVYTFADKTWEINSVEVPIRLLTSLTGYQALPYEIDPQMLTLPMEDLRDDIKDRYTPSEATGSMGVEMGSSFAAGSVGCINSVSRIIDNGTQDSPIYQLSWISAMLTIVPMPATAINGFEYTHNFTNKPATAVFRIGKDTMADTGSAQICHINASGAVDCAAPAVTDDGVQWTLKRSISESGIYVLSAAQETVPSY